jgi:hypothetical protein
VFEEVGNFPDLWWGVGEGCPFFVASS